MVGRLFQNCRFKNAVFAPTNRDYIDSMVNKIDSICTTFDSIIRGGVHAQRLDFMKIKLIRATFDSIINTDSWLEATGSVYLLNLCFSSDCKHVDTAVNSGNFFISSKWRLISITIGIMKEMVVYSSPMKCTVQRVLASSQEFSIH